MSETRKRRPGGYVTTADIAAEFMVTPHCIRIHLRRLEEERGRFWSATPGGHARFTPAEAEKLRHLLRGEIACSYPAAGQRVRDTDVDDSLQQAS